ncbi:hypothetical protein B0I35DRAFT_407842 [Stachybotrys elegans]|uniref:Xylanolytic transcriptional activator regulatory domain-containing protein n=1 Tax=Stachybotrys elegans TaxID=80388 RepID=A0A8K0SXV4_9HYPO|nr:hypothetical protein B0I35DRAFT_407842 [Stachybotrys elegans]
MQSRTRRPRGCGTTLVLAVCSSSLRPPPDTNPLTSTEDDQLPACNRKSVDGVPALSRILSNLSAPLKALFTHSRYILPSHWIAAMTLLPPLLQWSARDIFSQKSEGWRVVQECVEYGKVLDRRLAPSRVAGEYGRLAPSIAVSEKLLRLYLETFELVYRVLHIPTFLSEFRRYAQDPAQARTLFIIQLQLCMALGAVVHDDVFSYKKEALQWIQEAEDWLASEEVRDRSSIAKVQIRCLLCIARHATGPIWSESTWIQFTTLIPSAMVVALHRDPSKLFPMSPASAEFRRRLWTTVLELSLNSTVDAGQPPLFSLDNFDCELPSNLDDDQLDFASDSTPTPKDEGVFTQTSTQIALGRSFAVRMAILKHGSCLRSAGPEQTLALSSDLMAAAQALRATVHGLQPKTPSFQRYYSDMIMKRYIFAHHMPIVPLRDPNMFSLRSICVDAAFSACYSVLDAETHTAKDDPLLYALRQNGGVEAQCPEVKRLLLCCNGIPRSNTKISMFVIGADIYYMSEKQESLQGSQLLRSMEARLLLRGVCAWSENGIKAGQRNVVDRSISEATWAMVNALIEGHDVDEAIAEHGDKGLQQGQRLLAEMAGDEGLDREANDDIFEVNEEDMDRILWDVWSGNYSQRDWINYASMT